MKPIVSTGLVRRVNKVYSDWIETSIHHHTSINEACICNLLYVKYGPDDDQNIARMMLPYTVKIYYLLTYSMEQSPS